MPNISPMDRDFAIVRSIVNFMAMNTNQVHELHFPGLTRRVVQKRLDRLTAGGYLRQLAQYRLTGGARGGSGPYVYVPGQRGHFLFKDSDFTKHPHMTDRLAHALGIVNIYVALVKLHRQGAITLHGYLPEPDCHLVVGSYHLKPDLYVEVESGGRSIPIFIEYDRGSENIGRIHQKIRGYLGAGSLPGEWAKTGLSAAFPVVVFVGSDLATVAKLRWYMKKFPGQLDPSFVRAMTEDILLRNLAAPRPNHY